MAKVWLFRWAYRVIALFYWWRKAPRNLGVENRQIPTRAGTVGIRIYSPESAGPHPAIMFFHGGGFVVGDLNTMDGTCRDLAANAGHTVISVDYRLAPEAPFPAAAHDCIDATKWLKAEAKNINVDAGRICVAGDSAGGNLAAVTALQLKDAQPNLIKSQILIYPVTHHYSFATPSYSDKAKGHGLTRNLMIWFWDHYYRESAALSAGQFNHPLSTPLAEDDLSGLPPALVLTAEHDPLRDEGIQYGEKMAAAGVAVQQTLYHDAQHGFVGSMGPTEDHRKAIAEIADWLAALYREPGL